jgi:hypothetical protein
LPRLKSGRAQFTVDYPRWRCIGANPVISAKALRLMTMLITRSIELQGSARGLLPPAVGTGVYVLLLLLGNKLLSDPDTLWQIAVGQWILSHRMVPVSDIYSFTMSGEPWISTQWLAQVAYALAWQVAGWIGPVVLAVAAIAAALLLLAKFLSTRLPQAATLMIVTGALVLMAPHLLARPHALAMPVLVAWVGGLVAAADRGEFPSLWLLPLIALWANLHGGFVFGLAVIGPIALDAVWHKNASARRALALRWAVFAVAALGASCITPYGWNAILASRKILGLGDALKLIGEWHPVSFGSIGSFEICLLALLGLTLWRGIVLPPLRIVLLLGLLHMAFSAARNQEVLALVAPIILAAPLARQIGEAGDVGEPRLKRLHYAGFALCVFAATVLMASFERYKPGVRNSPADAVAELKRLNVSRVFNDYDFGGYLIANGIATFIDGRTELFGEKFVVDHHLAIELIEPDNLLRMLKDYDIEATLLRTQSAASKLLDHLDGWQKVHVDGIATVHLRGSGASHTAKPVIRPTVTQDRADDSVDALDRNMAWETTSTDAPAAAVSKR